MKIIDLIRHYERIKTQHQPLSKSLGEKLIQLREAFGHLDANCDGPEIIAASRLYWSEARPGTVKRNLGQLRAVMKVAERTRLIQAAPWIEMPAVYDVVDVEITTEEMDILLDHIEFTESWAYPAITLLAHTGARIGEAFGLTAKSFLPDGVRFVKPAARRSKTVSRIVPYTKRMRLLYSSGAFNGVIFRTSVSFTKSYADEKSASAALHRVLLSSCESVGLPRLRVHDLRHAFAAIIAECGGDLPDIATALGHLNLSTSMRYRGLVKSRLQGVVAQV